MQLYILFTIKPIANLLCWYSSIYSIRFSVMSDDTPSGNYRTIMNGHTAHNDRAKPNPNIISYNRILIQSTPRIFLVPYPICKSDRNSYLLIVMVISSNYTDMIGNYDIVTNRTVCFYRRIFPYIEVISDSNAVTCPNEDTSSTMEILSYLISSPYYILVELVTKVF